MLTSIVHNFGVLYSNRIHQKDKKWTDGRLRYYEFNKKIEVYSDEGFLVCSDFYPTKARPPLEGGVFEDGNSYTLPSGKLIVEFSEYLGCMERDISKAFTKTIKKEVTVVTEREIKREQVQIKMEQENGLTANGRFLAIIGNVKQEPSEGTVASNIEISHGIEGGVSKQSTAHRAKTYTQGPRPIGLTRPKRTKQAQVTLFVLKMSVEEKLAKYVSRAPKRRPVRIPEGSNKLNTRLWRELGVTEEEMALGKAPEWESTVQSTYGGELIEKAGLEKEEQRGGTEEAKSEDGENPEQTEKSEEEEAPEKVEYPKQSSGQMEISEQKLNMESPQNTEMMEESDILHEFEHEEFMGMVQQLRSMHDVVS